MRIYIAGPITGCYGYKKKFEETEKKLCERGHIVLNPAFLPEGLKNYMGICEEMIKQADAIYFQKGFTSSTGSMQEYMIAVKRKKEDKNFRIFMEG